MPLARLLRKSSYRVTFFDGGSIECLQIYGKTMRSLYLGKSDHRESFPQVFHRFWVKSNLAFTKLRSLYPEVFGKFAIILS
jgi:hypothetical protein